MSASSVCALVDSDTPGLDAALAAQDRTPDQIVRTRKPTPGEARRALSAGAEWVWLLDGTALPALNALAGVMDALQRTPNGHAPVLVAGSVRTDTGDADPAWAPWYRAAPTEHAMAAVRRRLVPIRAAAGPLLLHRSLIIECGPGRPRLGRSAMLLEWSARALRERVGYWTADSHSVRVPGVAPPAGGARTAAALLCGGAFAGTERIRVALDLLA